MNNKLKNTSDTQKIIAQQDSQMMRAVWENITDALIIINEKGIIELFNPAAEHIFGYAMYEVIGKNVNILMPKPHQSNHDTYIRNYLETGISKIIGNGREVQGLKKDGTIIPIELNLNEIFISRKRLIVGIGRDISERKRIEKQLELQIAALESAANAIVLTDREGNITWVNPAFYTLTGYTPEEIFGQNTRLLKSYQHDDSFYMNIWNTIQQGEVWRGEIINRRKDGSFYTEEMTITPVRDEKKEITNFIAIKQDISRRKEIEQLKEEFLSIVSHELRTPLTSIRGALGIISEGLCGHIPEKALSLINLAYKDIGRLVRLANKVLQVEKIDSQTLYLKNEPVEIMPIIHNSVELNKHYGDQFRIKYAIKNQLPGARVCADNDGLIQVLTNLLSNAAKFSYPDTTVHIGTRRNKHYIRVEVTNSGPPIPPESHHTLFQKFAHIDIFNAQKKGGTGLGLYITKAIIEKLNGRIGFTSTSAEGTIFYFELPECYLNQDCTLCAKHPITTLSFEQKSASLMTETLTNKDSIQQSKTPPLTRILLVEDEPHLQKVAKLALELSGGYIVEVCSTGKEALIKAPLFLPELILLDVMMPEMDGPTTFKALKTISALSTIPVVFITAKVQLHELDHYKQLGALDVIKKPFNPKELAETIKKIWIHYHYTKATGAEFTM